MAIIYIHVLNITRSFYFIFTNRMLKNMQTTTSLHHKYKTN